MTSLKSLADGGQILWTGIFVCEFIFDLINFSLYPLTDIWLIGDSLMTHLKDMAAIRGSLNLGIPGKRIVWLGTRGMRWEHLRAKFQLMIIQNPPPVTIIIHLGGNDLVAVKQAKLMRLIKRDIRYIASVFPSAQIIWSDILPRKSWRGVVPATTNFFQLNQKRKRINRAGHLIVPNLPLGKVTVHEIDTTPGFFKPDGEHLSLTGNAVFLNTIQEAVRTFFTNATQNVYDAN